MFIRRAAACRPTLAAGAGLALFLSSAQAFADKVAVLPFSGTNSAASKADLEAARGAAQNAVAKGGHTQPAPSEMLTAEMAVKDGVADTSEELRAAGRASSSQWTMSARVEPHGPGQYRLEIEVCQVKSGRVESLAREIDAAQAVPQIGEMLALLLRPEGIANAPIPWERASPALPPPQETPAQPPAPTTVQVAPPPPAPAQPEAVKPYGEGRPLAVGAGLGFLSAFVRPDNAQGTATSLFLSGSLGYALEQVLPGLELRADFGGALAGPKALLFEGGARYMRTVVPSLRMYAGPEAEIGAFFTLGGNKTTRFLARGAGVLGMALSEQAAVELSADLAVAPGGGGTLAFAGASARGVLRF
ncbi:hypothetical protein LVJ94_00085 [Pendulispora rubella]|uniref:Outer membrane protein beta-barrel domain-containing protein n=1 Tax=Pendulispora rubella TaxID=2741070 RepID=A0ABZ2L3X9_9BACT